MDRTLMIPGRGRVLLRRVESGESYPGGTIIIPETVRDALMAQHAEVVAVGEPAWCDDYESCQRPMAAHGFFASDYNAIQWLHPCGLSVGDWVLVGKRAGVECGDETGNTYLVTADDVLAVIQP